VKFLLWVIIIVLVVAWFMRQTTVKARDPATDTATASQASQTGGGERMIQCAHCGLHVPASESIADATGVAYCSEEHRRLGVRT
jgi:uncharacterized protein